MVAKQGRKETTLTWKGVFFFLLLAPVGGSYPVEPHPKLVGQFIPLQGVGFSVIVQQ